MNLRRVDVNRDKTLNPDAGPDKSPVYEHEKVPSTLLPSTVCDGQPRPSPSSGTGPTPVPFCFCPS